MRVWATLTVRNGIIASLSFSFRFRREGATERSVQAGRAARTLLRREVAHDSCWVSLARGEKSALTVFWKSRKSAATEVGLPMAIWQR